MVKILIMKIITDTLQKKLMDGATPENLVGTLVFPQDKDSIVAVRRDLTVLELQGSIMMPKSTPSLAAFLDKNGLPAITWRMYHDKKNGLIITTVQAPTGAEGIWDRNSLGADEDPKAVFAKWTEMIPDIYLSAWEYGIPYETSKPSPLDRLRTAFGGE